MRKKGIKLTEHSEQCFTVGYKFRCSICVTKYNREQKRKHRRNVKMRDDMKIKTRSVIPKKGAKYDHVVCDKCKKNKFKDYCTKCSDAYNAARQKNYRRMKLERNKIQSESKGMGQVIKIGHESKILPKDKCQVSGIGNEIKDGQKNTCQDNVTCTIKKNTKKKIGDKIVVTKMQGTRKKRKKSLKDDYFLDPNTGDFENNYADSTIRNVVSKINTEILHDSPRKTLLVCSQLQDRLADSVQECLRKRTSLNFEEKAIVKKDCNDETLQIIYDNYLKQNNIKKSADKYKLINSLQPIVKDKPINQLRKSLKLSYEKASQLKEGDIERAKRKSKITDEHKSTITDFYHRSDISRLQPGQSTKKKWNN